MHQVQPKVIATHHQTASMIIKISDVGLSSHCLECSQVRNLGKRRQTWGKGEKDKQARKSGTGNASIDKTHKLSSYTPDTTRVSTAVHM